MKIVGTINRRNFLAELTLEEIDYLAGKKIGSDKGYYGNERDISSGTTFDIVKAFEQIHRSDNRRKEIESVRKTLEGVLNSLDIIDRFIDEPKAEAETENVLS